MKSVYQLIAHYPNTNEDKFIGTFSTYQEAKNQIRFNTCPTPFYRIKQCIVKSCK